MSIVNRGATIQHEAVFAPGLRVTIRDAEWVATSPDGTHVPHLNDATFRKLQRQAALQVASRGGAVPAYELLTPDQTDGPRGLYLLPPPSKSDVFFDMEGFPLIDDGREYLFGACFYEKGKLLFGDWWAHSPAEERLAFEAFVLWAHRRWQEDRTLCGISR